MCSICLKNPCHTRCPNYIPPKAKYYCSICDDGIYNGEEYIVNNDGDYAHWECCDSARELLEFLKCKIKIMEEESE